MSFVYNCAFLREKLKEGGQLIDVRSPLEFDRGALDGAMNLPIDRFQRLQHHIDESRPVLLYCRTGARSEMVKRYLDQQGYDEVYNIGGINRFTGC